MPVYAELISIGDEILYGQTLDTNSHWISGRLDEIGIKVRRKITIGDLREDILNSLAEAEKRADVILITGGLGPTKDDLTKPLLGEYFQTPLIRNQEVLSHIETLFARAGRPVGELNEMQADLPANCTPIKNNRGTAPGMWFEKEGKIFVSMPGVPYEMKAMMDESILPQLSERFVGEVICHRVIKTIGIPESTLAELIADWEDTLPESLKLAYLPTMGQVKLRLTGMGKNLGQVENLISDYEKKVLPIISKYVYGYGTDEIEQVIGKMLLKANKTLAVAESCTGGYLSHLVTTVPGSSQYFKGGIISYNNHVKTDTLEVSASDIQKEGAVSEQVVLQMAQKVREKLGADVGISTSGIAGPGGGTDEKPVGTVWIGYADERKCIARKFTFSKDRMLNIHWTALSAFNLFRLNFSSN